LRVIARPIAVADSIQHHIGQVRAALAEIPSEAVQQVVEAILLAHDTGRHIFTLGNGGSASTATHFAADLSKSTVVGGRSRLRVTSLSDNVALMTAWANDTSYERVFAEPLINLLDTGDVVIAISASGKSPNVLEAIKAASDLGAVTVGLIGFDGGPLKDMVDLAVKVNSHDYGVVEDCHLVLEHAITSSIRAALLA
jgi:D-sedoheptulose 7-phosphate isomerase